MQYSNIIEETRPELEKAEDSFKQELAKLRSSRLSPGLVEDIEADCFGQMLPLKQLGAISAPSSRQLALQLWDKSYVEGVIKAIEAAQLGLGIRVDEKTVYLTSPPLSEETRQNLIQLLNKKKEEAFQVLRHIRDRAWKEIQEGFQRSEIREDDKFRGKDKLDELVREYRGKFEEMSKNKEAEIKG